MFTKFSHFRDDYAVLCSVDEPVGTHCVIIYNLTDLTMIQSFPGHTSGIFQVISSGDILLTRDKNGVIFMWDINLATDENYQV